jgi:hypothetical protein
MVTTAITNTTATAMGTAALATARSKGVKLIGIANKGDKGLKAKSYNPFSETMRSVRQTFVFVPTRHRFPPNRSETVRFSVTSKSQDLSRGSSRTNQTCSPFFERSAHKVPNGTAAELPVSDRKYRADNCGGPKTIRPNNQGCGSGTRAIKAPLPNCRDSRNSPLAG